MTSTFCLCVQSAISNVIMGYRNADSSLLNKGLVQGGGVTIAAAAVYAAYKKYRVDLRSPVQAPAAAAPDILPAVAAVRIQEEREEDDCSLHDLVQLFEQIPGAPQGIREDKNRIRQWMRDNLQTIERVTHLGLSGKEISTLPREILHFKNLFSLDLRNNRLTKCPPWLGKLAQLQWLDLSHNQLSGTLPPWLGKLAQLQWLYLSDNYLSGSLPPWLGKLAQLRALDLFNNQLSESLPPWLGNLTQLQRLDLSDNQLSGTLPPRLGDLVHLQWLDLAHNRLSGTLPPELGNLAQLRGLNLSDNYLSGALPSEFGRLAQLQVLELSRNEFTSLPDSLTNLGMLDTLDLSDNPILNVSDGLSTWLVQRRHFSAYRVPYFDGAANHGFDGEANHAPNRNIFKVLRKDVEEDPITVLRRLDPWRRP